MGDVGPNHYVELINLVLRHFRQSQATSCSVRWTLVPSGLDSPCPIAPIHPAIRSCLYDQLTDRWILSQFTTSGLDDPDKPFWNCVAISTTRRSDRHILSLCIRNGVELPDFFPDYPKYGVWTDSYVITTREFGPNDRIWDRRLCAWRRTRWLTASRSPICAASSLMVTTRTCLPLVGDGLLPADIDGKQKPKNDTAIPIVGTQDDGAGYGGDLRRPQHF